MEFSVLGFEFYLSILVGCVYLAGAYLLAIGPARVRYAWAPEAVSRARKVSYLGAVLLIIAMVSFALRVFTPTTKVHGDDVGVLPNFVRFPFRNRTTIIQHQDFIGNIHNQRHVMLD